MCGIGLVVSGVAMGGHSFSSIGPPPHQGPSEIAGTARPNIQDLCGSLKQRGPDHVGGATLQVWPLKQCLEKWVFTHVGITVSGGSRNVHQSECRTRFIGNEGVKECVVPSLANEGAAQSHMSDSSCSARLQFIGAVLQLRGDHPVTQPLEDSHGNVLVYNGEVFGGLVVRGNENDSEILLEALCGCCGCACHSSRGVSVCQCQEIRPHQTITQLLSRLRGPWALIYWQAVSQTLWFGRDAIGRRSLLIHQPSLEDPRLLLTSVAPDLFENTAGRLKYWEELVCGIYSIGFSVMNEGDLEHGLSKSSGPVPSASSVEQGTCQLSGQEFLTGWTRLHEWEDPWLRTLLAWERYQVDPGSISSRESSQSHLCDDQQLSTGDVKLLARKEGQSASRSGCLQDASGHGSWEQRAEGEETPVQRVLAALSQAVKRRTINIQRHWGKFQSDTSESTSTESSLALKGRAPFAVLFSGGLDSMILAALADQFVDLDCSIDLLNVSFDGKFAPDRITAITGLAELREAFPSRRWRLIEIDAELADLTEYRPHLESLICPSDTYMDLNIGTALWLAASGKGRVREPPFLEIRSVKFDVNEHHLASQSCPQEPEKGESSESGIANSACGECLVSSEARVLLVGSGADEQCGGYGRHRTKFRTGGWKSLEAEMRLDYTRIWKRNLGRDDRCISDQGKEARFPFLDEDVISTLLSISLWEVVDLQQPAGIGDKKILRQVAEVLGLKRAASLPKRAIQFGSRIAQESNRKDFGSNRAANQVSAGSVLLKKIEQ